MNEKNIRCSEKTAIVFEKSVFILRKTEQVEGEIYVNQSRSNYK